MKTKDAFAFRDFDGERILQRDFFLHQLGVVHCETEINGIVYKDTDADTLEIYYNVAGVSHNGAKAMEQKLSELRKVTFAVSIYKERLDRHLIKLGGYVSRYAVDFTKSNADVSKKNYARADELTEKYTACRTAIEQLLTKCKEMINTGENDIRQQYRIEFATSLKRIRQEKKMSQRELAGRLGVAVPTLSQYENCIVEPTMKNLIRLANVLSVSTDELLGRCC